MCSPRWRRSANVTDLSSWNGPVDLHRSPRIRTKGSTCAPLTLGFTSKWNERSVLAGINLHLAPGRKGVPERHERIGQDHLAWRILGGGIAPTAGSLQMDGHPVNSLDLEQVRSMIGDSLSDEDVFTGTVMDNIAVGRSWITEEHIIEACRVTGLMERLALLPDGLLTKLDPQGARLPRSLVKRIVQARTIAGSPRMILLEDSLQDWELHDREQLLGWITAPERPWTLLIVSNDPLLQQHFQRIVSLATDGRITVPDQC
jgi:ABC-type transport system involved in cytochrome bd biosynthesis fused ATPase/permease subunit